MNLTDLAREQKAAIDFFLTFRNDESLLQRIDESLPESLLESGFVAASTCPFKLSTIPKQKTWIWNQSNRKAVVRFDSYSIVSLYKISPRKKVSTVSAPSYKIWLFRHFHCTSQQELYFLWCEKGKMVMHKPLHGVSTEIGIVHPETLTVDDLKFLKPWM